MAPDLTSMLGGDLKADKLIATAMTNSEASDHSPSLAGPKMFPKLERFDLRSVRPMSRSCSHWVFSLLFDSVHLGAQG